MVSDIALKKKLPEAFAESISAYVGCVAGALLTEDYIGCIKNAGFNDIKIVNESNFPGEGWSNDPILKSIIKETGLSKQTLRETAGSIVSIKVFAKKPL
jgi:arsenite methyltransferase